jgi:hypothetical protein
MAHELVPPNREAEAATDAALALARIGVEPARPGDASTWRLAAALEAVDRAPVVCDRYALSPRSTRGATRA